MERLKWIAIVLDSVQPFRGCQIISVVNSYRPQGNQAIN
jgi:gamma-tubulin complex component 3